MMKCAERILVLFMIALIWSCGDQAVVDQPAETVDSEYPPFTTLGPDQTGIDFINEVENQENFNILTYRNYYNGAGVGIGDVNNDGLNDIYFTSNMGPNKLFINKGDFKFEDVTENAGVSGTKYWSTGVAMADVDGDGWLDIYVCNSGDIEGENKENELFINNGDLTFTEKAQEYGLNNLGYSTHASFFDYDLDGDLDCFVLNNSYKDPDRIALYARMRDQIDELGGDKLYRNNGDGTFTDVTVEAGIFTSQIGFGLGVSIGDLNGDLWPDIYISNDFWERDYLYFNQQDGTFKEDLPGHMSYSSVASMGSDVADIDNDGDLDIFSTDMLPPDNYRLKAATQFSEYHLDDYKFRSNYHYQLVQNCLQVNDGEAGFQESAFMSGVAATDWSWGALIFDIDLDGLKDIFVSNGLYHDITDRDFISFIADKESIKQVVEEKGRYDFRDFLPYLPHNPRPNYAFINKGDLRFDNRADQLGLGEPGYSNGSAYGDLDNDGDYDLVINNVNMQAFVHRNEMVGRNSNNYVKIKLNGRAPNKWGVGTIVKLYSGGDTYISQCMPARGFESSVDPDIIFGLGSKQAVDSIIVIWPDHAYETVRKVSINSVVTVDQENAGGSYQPESKKAAGFVNATSELFDNVPAHVENRYNDFDHERLIPHMLSRQGPAIVLGDVNSDGSDDLLLLGASGDPDKLYLFSQGKYRFSQQEALNSDAGSESTCGAFIDLDGDGDLDIVIGVGGNEYEKGFPTFRARFYKNDGQGNFAHMVDGTPTVVGQVNCIEPFDFDNDGDTDMFVGGHVVPGAYGLTPRSFMLRNDGEGKWTDITNENTGPIGMVSDAAWHDVDGDGLTDLIVVGEWMPVTLFKNTENGFVNAGIVDNSSGWWTRIEGGDLDGDGDTDFVLGNWGKNMKFQPTPQRPMRMYVNDFDDNQKPECIIEWYPPDDDKPYPFASKMDLTAQMPHLKKENLMFHDYAEKQVPDLFSREKLDQSLSYSVTNMESSILWNGDDGMRLEALPIEAQIAPVFGIVIQDIDGDGITDIYLGGNFYGLKPEVGRMDGNQGGYFKGTGGGSFAYVSNTASGIQTSGEVRDAKWIMDKLVVARNDREVQVFQMN